MDQRFRSLLSCPSRFMGYIAMSEETHARRGKKDKVVVLDNEAAALRKNVQASRSFFSGGSSIPIKEGSLRAQRSPRKRRLTTALSLEEYVPFPSFLPSIRHTTTTTATTANRQRHHHYNHHHHYHHRPQSTHGARAHGAEGCCEEFGRGGCRA